MTSSSRDQFRQRLLAWRERLQKRLTFSEVSVDTALDQLAWLRAEGAEQNEQNEQSEELGDHAAILSWSESLFESAKMVEDFASAVEELDFALECADGNLGERLEPSDGVLREAHRKVLKDFEKTQQAFRNAISVWEHLFVARRLCETLERRIWLEAMLEGARELQSGRRPTFPPAPPSTKSAERVVVRPAREEDQGEVVRICKESMQETYGELLDTERMEPWVNGDEVDQYVLQMWPKMFLAFREDDVVGVASVDGDLVDLLWVSDGLRSSGIGGKLLSWLEGHALSKKSIDQVRVECFASNEDAISFYEAQGYVKFQRYPDAAAGVDKVLLIKKLA